MADRNPVTPDKFAETLARDMAAFTEKVAEFIKQGVDKIAAEARKEVRSRAPVDTGKYRKAIRVKKGAFENRFEKRNVVYAAAPHYRRVHLLERGYQLRSGGRTAAQPHMRYGEELVERRMDELGKEAVNLAGD